MQARLEALDVEDLRTLARLYGFKNYSYKELLTDLLMGNVDNRLLEEDLYELERTRVGMEDYLRRRNVKHLRELAQGGGIAGYRRMNKAELIDAILNRPRTISRRQSRPTRRTPTRKTKKASKVSKGTLEDFTVKKLKELAKNRGLTGYSRMRKAELILLLS